MASGQTCPIDTSSAISSVGVKKEYEAVGKGYFSLFLINNFQLFPNATIRRD